MRVFHRRVLRPRVVRPRIAHLLPAVLLLLGTTAGTAQTADPYGGIRSDIAFGVRAGYTHWSTFDQLHFGAHLKLGEILPNVRVVPNIEAGLGDQATIIIANGDVVYDFTEFFIQPWNVYGGPSLSLNSVNPDGPGSYIDLGLGAVLGVERTLDNGHQALVEMRFGLIDSPDFKLTFGYTLY